MKETLKIVKEEVQSLFTSKTLDALIPPIIFVIVQSRTTLLKGIIFAIGLAFILALYRLIRKQSSIYAFAGVIGVSLTGGYAYFMGSASSYFLPKIIGSGIGAVLSLLSIVFGRPLAAYLSHLSRGWPLKWFWRKDIKPAYREVTFAWAILFSLRLFILLMAYRKVNLSALVWLNTLLGTPATAIVLISTLLYGTFRLKKLGGPGVEEYKAEKEPPWKGQTRGF